MRAKRRKPSPALAVALVALVAALGGTAVGGVVGRALTSQEVKQVKTIAKRLDEKIELMPGPKGDTGEKGDQGVPGSPGQDGSDAASFMTADIKGLASPAIEYGTPSGFSTASLTEEDVVSLSPNAPIVARDPAVRARRQPSADCLTPVSGCAWTFTLRDDGVDTAVACTIGGIDLSCNSGAGTAVIAPGSRISIKGSPSGFPTVTDARIGWRATTP
jgi:hypothetical protein